MRTFFRFHCTCRRRLWLLGLAGLVLLGLNAYTRQLVHGLDGVRGRGICEHCRNLHERPGVHGLHPGDLQRHEQRTVVHGLDGLRAMVKAGTAPAIVLSLFAGAQSGDDTTPTDT